MSMTLPPMPVPGAVCHLCGASSLALFSTFPSLPRVSSDCKPWPAGAQLGICPTCHGVQRAIDQSWYAEIQQIYANYTIYHQSDGVEQAVFEQGSGQAAARSTQLIKQLTSHLELPVTGRMLDIGCGNGAFLRSASCMLPSWSLAGTEIGDKYREAVERIEGVEQLYTCAPAAIPGNFDMIVLLHVLEHVEYPIDFLAQIRAKLTPSGILVVEIPHFVENPVDLLIADHATHYTPDTISSLIQRSGFQILAMSTNWIPKELSVVARPSAKTPASMIISDFYSAQDQVDSALVWLHALIESGRSLMNSMSFGIFGTSIGGTWLYNVLTEKPLFFVDEDPNRVGTYYMGVPVYHPEAVPSNSDVLIALPPKIAAQIQQRLSTNSTIKYHIVSGTSNAPVLQRASDCNQ